VQVSDCVAGATERAAVRGAMPRWVGIIVTRRGALLFSPIRWDSAYLAGNRRDHANAQAFRTFCYAPSGYGGGRFRTQYAKRLAIRHAPSIQWRQLE